MSEQPHISNEEPGSGSPVAGPAVKPAQRVGRRLRPLRIWSVENKVRAGFGVALVFLALAGAVAWLNAARGAKAFQAVEQTHAVMAEIQAVMTAMLNIDNGVNRFVATGDEKFLQPGYGLREQVSKSLAELRRLTQDNPRQQQRLERLEAITAQNRLNMAQIVRVRRTNEVAAKELVGGGKSQFLTDAMQVLIEEMEGEETRLLRQRGETVQTAGQASVRLVEFGGLAALGITAVAGLAVLRGTRRRAQAELALRENKESLAVTLQSIGDGVLATDAEGRVTQLNAVAGQLTSWTQAEALGRPVAEVFNIINETTRAPAFLPVADTLAKGTIHGLANHTLLIARDGTERPIADSCAPIRNREGAVIGAVLVFRDVTEEQAAAQALRASKRELEAALHANQLIMAHSLDVICTIDQQGRFAFVSAACERVWGCPPVELVGRNYIELVHPEDHPRTSQAVADIMAGKSVRDFENRCRRKDGSLVAMVWSAAWSPTDQLMFCVAHDVTERKQAEAQMAESRRTLADFKAALDEHAIVAITDARGRITYVNDKFCAISKYARAELLGQDHRLINSGHHPKDFIRELWATINSGRVWKGEIKNRAKDGSLYWVDTTIVPFLGPDGKPTQFIAIRADITKRKQTEESLRQALHELSRAIAELDRASKLKDEFLANMSHELRTPLNAILGLSEALLEQVAGPLNPRQVKSVTTISTSGQHLLALINDILDLSKIEAGRLELHREPLLVEEFCQGCLIFVQTQALHKHISVAFEHAGCPARFQADPKRFKQVLVNLLANAVKFTPEGGRIGLTVAVPEGGDVIRFTVWDTGIGIAAADQTKLFQAFTQVDSGLNRAQEGTGLGLALVGKLAELHGGSVALESEPGKGSRFIVTLPLPAGSAGGPPDSLVTPSTSGPVGLEGGSPLRDGEDSLRAACAPQSFRRALVIEDDPTAADQLVHYLAGLGLASVVHPRGEESVEAARREQPDVILLDIQLPNESGWVALAKLKEHPHTRAIPVAVVSVVDEPEKSRALGAAAHFTKPVTREQLAGFLQRPLPQKAPPVPRALPKAAAIGPVILLAEDNEANVQTIGGYLQDKGYRMHYAMNGLAAVKLARELQPALILMDIQMPLMDGLTAIKEIRADPALPTVPIVALTALAMTGDRERCLAAGATDYMSKPVKLKQLAALVEGLLPHTGEGGGI